MLLVSAFNLVKGEGITGISRAKGLQYKKLVPVFVVRLLRYLIFLSNKRKKNTDKLQSEKHKAEPNWDIPAPKYLV